jgi:superfamily I DNA and/or RNA helicase
VRLLPRAKILVTTNSNSACDEIGNRLLNFIGPNQIYRFYSANFVNRIKEASEKVVRVSNLKSGGHKHPSFEEVMSCNVVLSSLVNCGRLSSISSHHFDFIIVDECASVAEAFVNIPISLVVPGLAASIVLLGDPKQLGQTVKCFHAERYVYRH